MTLLQANQLELYIQDRLIFKIDQLQINERDRIGLVGKNGSGKTTLLEVLSGRKSPDRGHIQSETTRELLPQLKEQQDHQSGGERTQAYIQHALTRQAGILFADEPTSHLDTEHMIWLEKQFHEYPGAIVLVSHDRTFLDEICSIIWELKDGTFRVYPGNYTDYLEQKEIEHRTHEAAYDQYIQKKRQLEQALQQKIKKAERATKTPKKISPSEARIIGAKPYFAKKQKKLHTAAKSIETRLEKLEKVEKIRETPPIRMDLPNDQQIVGRIIIRVHDLLGKIGDLHLWDTASFEVRGGDKLAIMGANGSGKTTLIKKIIEGKHGVALSPAVKIGYFSQHIDILQLDQSILDNVRSSSKQDETLIRTVLARLHFFRDDVYKPIQVLSGGERVKVAFAKIFLSDINTLILDEPTNFLDIEAVEALESLLRDYPGTVIFVSHDRRFVEQIATRILTIEGGKIQLFNGTFQELKQYEPQETRDSREDQLLLIETQISEVLSRLSIEPSEALDIQFQQLLAEKQRLMDA